MKMWLHYEKKKNHVDIYTTSLRIAIWNYSIFYMLNMLSLVFIAFTLI